jgi:putative FmdB family regulatory protein
MPNYDFVCNCGYSDEAFIQIIDRNKPRMCPKCGRPLIRLVGSGAAIIFKGDGFYCTTYPKGKNNAV